MFIYQKVLCDFHIILLAIRMNKISKRVKARAGIFNPDIKRGVVLSYDKSELPKFTEWQMFGNTEYVLGLEPGNCTPDGRDVLRKNGTLQFIEAGESKKTAVKFSFTDDEQGFEAQF